MAFVSSFIVSKYDAPRTFEIAPISKTPPIRFTLRQDTGQTPISFWLISKCCSWLSSSCDETETS